MKTARTKKFNYALKRSNRKSMGFTIERDGAFIVRAPFNLGDEEIKKFVWLYPNLSISNKLIEWLYY
jgi:hypothetical protein